MNTPIHLPNPYVGPRAFEERDGERFFGRERELDELFHLLLARRLVLLHSPSGAGKSSLVQARLMPLFRDEGFAVAPRIRLRSEAPAGSNRFVYATLLSLEEARPVDERFEPDDLAAMSLLDYFTRRPPPDTEELLVFDQFEEVLSIDPTDQASKQAFFAQLGTLLEDPRRWALFAMREDYLGAIKPFLLPIPTRLAATYRLDLLQAGQAIQAMQGPPQSVGGSFSNAAAQQLADDLRRTVVQLPDGSSEIVLGNAIEPVQLQVVCYRLWQRKAGQAAAGPIAIDTPDIEAAGSVDEALAGYYAEQVTLAAQAGNEVERSVRTWIERELITSGDLRGQVLREPERTAGLSNAAIQVLVDAHLLRAEERRGAVWYELAHDRLVTPVQANNERWRSAHLTTLQRQAVLWNEQRRPEGLLLRGATLREAEAETDEAGLNEVEREFLAACRAARAAEEKAERQRRRILWSSGFAFVGLALALILAAVAWTQFVEAEAQANQARTAEADAEAQAVTAQAAEAIAEERRREAEVQSLAFASQLVQERDPDLALLLAYEAFANERNEITRETLQTAVSRHRRLGYQLGNYHSAMMRAIAWSPDGSRIATTADDRTTIIWDAATLMPLRRLHGHADSVAAVAWAPDGNRLVTVSDDQAAIIWDVAGGDALGFFRGHTDGISQVDWSPDGRYIATGGEDGLVIIWDADAGNELHVLEENRESITGLAWSPDSSSLLTVAIYGEAFIWDAESGTPQTSFRAQAAERELDDDEFLEDDLDLYEVPEHSIAWSPDASRVITSSRVSAAQVWDVDSGEELFAIGDADSAFRQVHWHRDDDRIIILSEAGTMTSYDATSGAQLATAELAVELQDAAWNADGSSVVGVTPDHTLIAWDGEGTEIARSRRGHGGYLNNARSPDDRLISIFPGDITVMINDVTWSPDGSLVATASADYTAIIWEAASGESRQILIGHESTVEAVAWSPDGTRLVTASGDATAIVWDVSSGAILARLEGHSNGVWDAAWSPDGTRLATASHDNTAIIWANESWEPLATLQGHDDYVNGLAWSPDGTRLVTASSDRTAIIWNVATAQPQATLRGHSDAVISVAWSPDGRRIATASHDTTAMVWDPDQGNSLLTLRGHTGRLTSVGWSPDGREMLTTSEDQQAIIWNVVDGRQIARLAGHGDQVLGGDWSPDGTTITTAGHDGRAMLWSTTQDNAGLTLRVHENEITSLAWSPDGSRIVSAAGDENAIIWEVASGRQINTLDSDALSLYQLAWSADGTRIAAVEFFTRALIWDAASGAQLLALEDENDPINSLAWSPDGSRIVTGGEYGTITIWDAADGEQLANWQSNEASLPSIRALAWSPDGRRIASASSDFSATIWDASSGAEVLLLLGHSNAVIDAEWSPDGSRLLTASEDRTAIIWDAGSGEPLHVLKGHTNELTAASWSPDGNRVASASHDQTIIIWDANSGSRLDALTNRGSSVTDVAWSSDGQQLVSGAFNGEILIAETRDDESVVQAARCLIWRNFTVDEISRYDLDLPTAFSLRERDQVCP